MIIGIPSCDSGGIQTPNLLIRSQMLYSVEPRSRFADAKVVIFFIYATNVAVVFIYTTSIPCSFSIFRPNSFSLNF